MLELVWWTPNRTCGCGVNRVI